MDGKDKNRKNKSIFCVGVHCIGAWDVCPGNILLMRKIKEIVAD